MLCQCAAVGAKRFCHHRVPERAQDQGQHKLTDKYDKIAQCVRTVNHIKWKLVYDHGNRFPYSRVKFSVSLLSLFPPREVAAGFRCSRHGGCSRLEASAGRVDFYSPYSMLSASAMVDSITSRPAFQNAGSARSKPNGSSSSRCRFDPPAASISRYLSTKPSGCCRYLP